MSAGNCSAKRRNVKNRDGTPLSLFSGGLPPLDCFVNVLSNAIAFDGKGKSADASTTRRSSLLEIVLISANDDTYYVLFTF